MASQQQQQLQNILSALQRQQAFSSASGDARAPRTLGGGSPGGSGPGGGAGAQGAGGSASQNGTGSVAGSSGPSGNLSSLSNLIQLIGRSSTTAASHGKSSGFSGGASSTESSAKQQESFVQDASEKDSLSSTAPHSQQQQQQQQQREQPPGATGIQTTAAACSPSSSAQSVSQPDAAERTAANNGGPPRQGTHPTTASAPLQSHSAAHFGTPAPRSSSVSNDRTYLSEPQAGASGSGWETSQSGTSSARRNPSAASTLGTGSAQVIALGLVDAVLPPGAWQFDTADIEQLLRCFGTLEWVRILCSPAGTGKAPDCCIAQFCETTAASTVEFELDGIFLDGLGRLSAVVFPASILSGIRDEASLGALVSSKLQSRSVGPAGTSAGGTITSPGATATPTTTGGCYPQDDGRGGLEGGATVPTPGASSLVPGGARTVAPAPVVGEGAYHHDRDLTQGSSGTLFGTSSATPSGPAETSGAGGLPGSGTPGGNRVSGSAAAPSSALALLIRALSAAGGSALPQQQLSEALAAALGVGGPSGATADGAAGTLSPEDFTAAVGNADPTALAALLQSQLQAVAASSDGGGGDVRMAPAAPPSGEGKPLCLGGSGTGGMSMEDDSTGGIASGGLNHNPRSEEGDYGATLAHASSLTAGGGLQDGVATIGKNSGSVAPASSLPPGGLTGRKFVCRLELVDLFAFHPEFDVPSLIVGPDSSNIEYVLNEAQNKVDIDLDGVPFNEAPVADRLHLTVTALEDEAYRIAVETLEDLLQAICQQFSDFCVHRKGIPVPPTAGFRRHEYKEAANGQLMYLGQNERPKPWLNKQPQQPSHIPPSQQQATAPLSACEPSLSSGRGAGPGGGFIPGPPPPPPPSASSSGHLGAGITNAVGVVDGGRHPGLGGSQHHPSQMHPHHHHAHHHHPHLQHGHHPSTGGGVGGLPSHPPHHHR